MYQFVRLAQLIGLNAVPGIGFISLHWTRGTILALYWIETLLGSLLVAMRIDLHRRLTHKRGHYVTKKSQTVTIESGGRKRNVGTIFGGFVAVAFPFTIGEGIFLAFILSRLPEEDAVDFATLRFGVRLISVLLAAGFLIDLIGLRDRSFFWLHRVTNAMLARVWVLFFVVFLGIWVLSFFDAPRFVLLFFIAFKTFMDIAGELPESQTGEAPQWQLAIAGLFGPERRERFADYAREANKEYGTYSPDDEQVWEGA